MKSRGNIDQIRAHIFRNKAKETKLPFALRMRELEEVSIFINESKWRLKKTGNVYHHS